jgi:conjugative transfer signal peptidase TraF
MKQQQINSLRVYVKVLLWTLGLLVLAWAGYRLWGLRMNTTSSMPIGLWQLKAITKQSLHRGDAVFICPPKTPLFKMAYQRGYMGRGHCPSGFEPLLKRVAALPGDSVTLSAQGVTVNGVLISHSQAISCDVYGRALPALPHGRYHVGYGMVWVIANTNPASFDARYWGALPIANIEGTARPVWVHATALVP